MSGKVRYHELSEQDKKKYLGQLYSMIAILKTRDEVKNFFKDLLTLSEIVMISRRIEIARLLLEGSSHEDIIKRMKVGKTTITGVERWLNNGFGGYKEIIKRYKSKFREKDEFEKFGYPPFSKGWIRKKYPLYYLFSNLVSKR